MTVRNNLGELLNEVVYRHDAIVIQKSGKSVAAIVDMDLFEKIRLMQDEFDAMCNDLATKAHGLDEAVLMKTIDEAVETVRMTS